MNAIEITNFSVQYDDIVAVDNISLKIKSGSIVGFVGPNGSGKSSTLTNIMGIQKNYSGLVKILGKDIKTNNEYKALIGYVPEECELYEILTGSEYMDLVGKLYGLDTQTIKKKSVEFAKSFNIADKLNLRISNYSKGMKQKILIISALLHNPEILLLDEPLDGLDAQSIAIFKNLLIKLASNGKTVVYSSHIMEIVEEMSENIVMINKGKILASGTMKEIRENLQKKNLSLSEIFQELTGTINPETEADKLLNVLIN